MRKQRGFTLIELAIVVAVVALLAAIALPSYFEQVSRTRRTDGKNTLVDLAARQERYRFNNNVYTANLADLNIPATSGEGNYTVAIDAADANTFTARVTPTARQAEDKCEVLTITNTGLKGTINSYSRTAEDCWR